MNGLMMTEALRKDPWADTGHCLSGRLDRTRLFVLNRHSLDDFSGPVRQVLCLLLLLLPLLPGLCHLHRVLLDEGQAADSA